MEAKFTKGEWLISADGLSVEVDGFKVARAFSGSAIPYVIQATNNANLIATAPDMYAMLEMAMNILSGDDYTNEVSTDDIKALLAKARGEIK